MKQLIYIACFLFFSNGFGQDTLNKKDKKDFKQGHWIYLGKDRPEAGITAEGKIEEGNYINDRKEGTWIKYHHDGVTPKLVGRYENNRPNGRYIKYHENSCLRETGYFVKNQYHDSLKKYFENEQLEYCAFYDSLGKEKGVVQYFYSNGQLEFSYYALNGFPKGTSTRYYVNGDLMETIDYDSNGLELKSTQYVMKNAPIALLNSTEKTTSYAPKVFSDGLNDFNPNGNNKIYNEKGEIWVEGEFKNGQLWDGKVYRFNDAGVVIKIKVYKTGVFQN